MFSRRTAWNLSPNRYTEALEEHRRAGREVLDLTASNPTTIGLTYREDALLQSLTHREALTYEPVCPGIAFRARSGCTYYAEKGTRRLRRRPRS